MGRESVLNTELIETRLLLNECQLKLKSSEEEYLRLQEEADLKIKQIYEETKTKLEKAKVLEI